MIVHPDMARLVAGQAAVPAHISLFAQAKGYENITHLTGTSKLDVPGHEDVIHEDVQLGSLFLESSSSCSLERYEVVMVPALLQSLQYQAALLCHERLIGGGREAGDVGNVTHAAGVIRHGDVEEGSWMGQILRPVLRH